MGLLAPLADFTNTTMSMGNLNLFKNTFYNLMGLTPAGQGSVNWQNLSLSADIRSTQIKDQAMVLLNILNPGEQACTRPTYFSAGLRAIQTGGTGVTPDSGAGNVQAVALAAGAQNIALTAGKGMYTVTAAVAGSITAITGGVQDAEIFVVLKDANSTLTHSATNGANLIHLSRKASVVGDAGFVIIRLWFDARLNANGCWYEI